jgi:hypothetical protein
MDEEASRKLACLKKGTNPLLHITPIKVTLDLQGQN